MDNVHCYDLSADRRWRAVFGVSQGLCVPDYRMCITVSSHYTLLFFHKVRHTARILETLKPISQYILHHCWKLNIVQCISGNFHNDLIFAFSQSLLHCKKKLQKLYPVLFTIWNFLNCKKWLTQIKKVTHFAYFCKFCDTPKIQ